MSTGKDFSHVSEDGKINMVDVSKKSLTERTAVARAIVRLPEEVFSRLSEQNFQVAKGSVVQTAIIAGIMAAKRTGELIPLCHPLGLDAVNLEVKFQQNELVLYCKASVNAKTGVEMEALTGVSVAALTVYDMCKALSHDIVIAEIQLMEKSGGKHEFKREA